VPFFRGRGADPFRDLVLRFELQGLADRLVLGKRMDEHLRIGVCLWHSFAWAGTDMFGLGTFDRPWIAAADPMTGARARLAAAFEFLEKLGVPYYCFHDRDVAPEGRTFAESSANLDAIVDEAAAHQERTGVVLLWGTANLFSHPRCAAGDESGPRVSPTPPPRSGCWR
jgi:xylose isomerase